MATRLNFSFLPALFQFFSPLYLKDVPTCMRSLSTVPFTLYLSLYLSPGVLLTLAPLTLARRFFFRLLTRARLALIAWSLGKSQSGAVQSCKPPWLSPQLRSQTYQLWLRVTQHSECEDTCVYIRARACSDGVCVPKYNVYLFTLNPF